MKRREPKSGLSKAYARAYRRMIRGRWWQWRFWSKRANRKYHEARWAEAMRLASSPFSAREWFGYFSGPVRVEWRDGPRDES